MSGTNENPVVLPGRALLIAALASTILAGNAHAHFDEDIETLKACARIADQSTRIACLEAAGKALLEHDAESATSAPEHYATDGEPGTPEAGATAAPTADAPADTQNLAKSEAPLEVGPPVEPRWNSRVVDCRKSRNGRYRFTLDNGQIWKQSDYRRVSFKDCDFPATIEEVSFGYVLTYGEHRSLVRIRRVR